MVIHKSLKSIVKGASLVFVGMVLSNALWFATKIMIIRNTTVEALGIYSLAVAVVSALASISVMGLQTGITRFVSVYVSEVRNEDAKAISRAAINLSYAFGLAASVALALFAAPISKHVFYKGELTIPLIQTAPFVFFFVLSSVLVGITLGYGDVRARVYFVNVGQPLVFLAIILGFAYFKLPLDAIYLGFTMSMAIPTIALCAYTSRLYDILPVPARGGRDSLKLLKFSVPLFGSVLMTMVFTWTDTLMLGRYVSSEMVGLYSVSVSLSRLMILVITSVGVILLPIFSEYYSKNLGVEMERVYQVVTKWIFSMTLPLFFIFFLFPTMSIYFLFGKGYEAAAVSLSILSLGGIATVLMGPNNILLVSLGYTNVIMRASVIGGALNIALNYILIKRLGFGINGAATATTISMFVMSLITTFALYRRSAIHMITLNYIKQVGSCIVVGGFVYLLAKSLPLRMWMLPCYFTLFMAGYLYSLVLLRSFDCDDLFMFDTITAKLGLRLDFIRRLFIRCGIPTA